MSLKDERIGDVNEKKNIELCYDYLTDIAYGLSIHWKKHSYLFRNHNGALFPLSLYME